MKRVYKRRTEVQGEIGSDAGEICVLARNLSGIGANTIVPKADTIAMKGRVRAIAMSSDTVLEQKL
jgi:hypothetical protein